MEVLARTIRQEQEIKSCRLKKEEIKFLLFGNDTILHIENLKESAKILLALINKFIRVAAYKITVKTISTKRIKYLEQA